MLYLFVFTKHLQDLNDLMRVGFKVMSAPCEVIPLHLAVDFVGVLVRVHSWGPVTTRKLPKTMAHSFIASKREFNRLLNSDACHRVIYGVQFMSLAVCERWQGCQKHQLDFVQRLFDNFWPLVQAIFGVVQH